MTSILRSTPVWLRCRNDLVRICSWWKKSNTKRILLIRILSIGKYIKISSIIICYPWLNIGSTHITRGWYPIMISYPSEPDALCDQNKSNKTIYRVYAKEGNLLSLNFCIANEISTISMLWALVVPGNPLMGKAPVGRYNIKSPFYQYDHSHCKDETVVKPSNFYNRYSFIGNGFT